MTVPTVTPLHIGLTGGIGSGKSTVASMLVQLGATLVDTDRISRSLTSPGGAAIPGIASAFGNDFVAADGSLDRDRMRTLVFGEAKAKAKLESILHPLIGSQADREAAAATGCTVVFDVPLLAESTTWRGRLQRIIVVDCTEEIQVERVSRRPGWSVDAARRVVAQQASRGRRRAIADAVIHNEAITLEALTTQVHELWAQWIRNGAT